MKKSHCLPIFVFSCSFVSPIHAESAGDADPAAEVKSQNQAAVALTEGTEVLVDGFQTTVFAQPFDVEYPTALSAGPDGTVYVSVDWDGSLGHDYSGKVVACRDEDGDGQADRFWDFIPEVESPRGGHMVDGKFYLIHPPFLSVYWDEDGDGVAEKSKQLVDGLGASVQEERGGDHTTNGVRMGIDGWLYIAVGDFGMSSSTGTDGKTITLHAGGVARVRPDGTELEVYSYNTRNQCDVAISPYLDLFVRDNTNDGKGWNIRVHHQTNLSNHGYPRLYKNFNDEAVKPLLDIGGGSGTGALYLHEPGFPDGLGDTLFTCDWTTGKIYNHDLETNEATFRAEQEEWMNLVRATDIDVDGESRLYTSDWRNGRFAFQGKGVKVGMIHRVVPTGYEAEKWPDLEALESAELVSHLAHRSAVRRLEAQQILVRRGGNAKLTEALLDLIQGDTPLYGKVAAIFALKQMDPKGSNPALVSLLESEDVREFALRAAADRRGQVAEIPGKTFESLLNDESARVQLQAAVAMERGGRKDMAPALIKAAAASFNQLASLKGQDDYRFPHTAVEVLGYLQAVDACLAAVSDAETRGVALGALKLISSLEVVEGLEEILKNAGSDHQLRLEVMEVMARQVHREGPWDEKSWWGTRPDDRGPYFTLVRWEGSDRALKALEESFTKLEGGDKEKALEMMAANRLDVLEMDLGEQDPVLLALGLQNPGEGQIKLLIGAALDPERKWEQRLAAYRAVSRSDMKSSLRNQLEILAGWSSEPELAEESAREINEFINAPALILKIKELEKLGNEASPEVSKIAWKAILTFSRSPLIKERFKENAMAIAQNDPRALGYFHALAEMKLAGFEGPIAKAMEGDNQALIDAAKAAQEAIEGAAVESQGTLVAALDAKEVTAQVMAGAGKGDIELGKTLFTQQACASCHAISLDEVQKGPYLGSAGSKFTRDYLIESILEPGLTVAQGFRTEMVTMKDGAVHLGFITREEDGEIDLRNIGGVVTTLQTGEIAKREEQPQSMMPAGLASSLTVDQFNALIDYLGSLKEE
ncbi:DUF7133 domain-containing protein [Roseibacillus persicicus]|uniref:DUF7133 domain-containing protein n=1 Tax=Roseibacillus persicicus TaxID=454148 RepID=UPI00280DB1EF|nr:c-type cytochrome [Roseibacillus persicicus]MDQ8189271.1 c-type cytochrome [Roseibacillus persicicus]